MSFNSFRFGAFFAGVLAAYYLLPPRFQRPLLLASSYAFYMSWDPRYGLVLLAVTAISYAVALAVERRRERAAAWLAAGVGAHLSILLAFNYASFLPAPWAQALAAWGVSAQPAAPARGVLLGLSFYLFQSISYMADVYRRQAPAERGFARYALYLAFFPQLVAGPIERASQLLPQLAREHRFERARLEEGLLLILSGLFKKAVLAENLAIVVSAAFDLPESRSGLSLYLATVLAAYMLYCDIAGYTDIARGCAKTLGVELSRNFARPFAAPDIAQFWRRWHMTVSGFFRDYVLFALAATPLARLGVPALALTSFLLLGLWHGASWNYVVWGAVNGLLVAGHQLLARRGVRPLLPETARAAFTMLALVSLPMVFVVTPDLGTSMLVFERIFALAPGPGSWWDLGWMRAGGHAFLIAGSLVLIGGLEAAQKLQERAPLLQTVRRWPAPARLGAYGALALAACLSAALVYERSLRSSEFFYFRY